LATDVREAIGEQRKIVDELVGPGAAVDVRKSGGGFQAISRAVSRALLDAIMRLASTSKGER